jgi:hypothetical protein
MQQLENSFQIINKIELFFLIFYLIEFYYYFFKTSRGKLKEILKNGKGNTNNFYFALRGRFYIKET